VSLAGGRSALARPAASAHAQLRAQLERRADRPAPVVRYDRRAGERSPDLLRWGLIPHWAKDMNVGFANINAKAEGIENRPAFRDAFQRRRCLVPVDNFYEWKKTATGKQPICCRSRGSEFDGAGRVMGELALTRRRMGAQLRGYHDDAKRVVCGAAQPNAGGAGA
jgi:putative SOS response-associated peptidase YedK